MLIGEQSASQQHGVFLTSLSSLLFFFVSRPHTPRAAGQGALRKSEYRPKNYHTMHLRNPVFSSTLNLIGVTRAEVNFLPNFPQGKHPSSLEQLRQTIVEEVKKTEKNLPLIGKMMETTFPLRRQTTVMSCPPVNELMVIWISSLFKVKIVILTHLVAICCLINVCEILQIERFKCCCCIVLLLLLQFSCMQRYSGL